MLKFPRFLALSLLAFLLSATQTFAQNYPMPGAKSEPPVLCHGCTGKNVSGQNNDGLPTYPYDTPIVDHVGRYVDSNTTPSTRSGFRTARARFIEMAKTARGNAPPRAYIKIGNGVGAYSLDTLFTSKLPGSMISIGELFPSASYDKTAGRDPLEKILKWDAYVYPEDTNSGWQVPGGDFQDPFGKLHPIDFDDRGYVYIGTQQFGWGIVTDSGDTSGGHMKKVVQLMPKPDARAKEDKTGVTPHTVISLKSGSKYYVVVADTNSQAVWDVTNPATPVVVSPVSDTEPVGRTKLVGSNYGIVRADRHDGDKRVAVLTFDGRISIYDYASLASGGAPVAQYSATSGFAELAFDESGTLWAVETKAVIWRFSPSGSGYTAKSFTPFGGQFDPLLFHANAGYIAVGGIDHSSGSYDVKLFGIEAAGPKLLDTDGFFRKYYHASPAGYAQPGQYTSILNQSSDLQIIRWGGKTYLFYSGQGFGDVYELQGGNSINIVTKNAFGTPNPNAQSTEPGPYYGDLVTFVANSSNPQQAYDVVWDFGDGSGNGRSRTGEDEQHQYTGLTTAAQITTPKVVRAQTVQDPNISAQINLTLKLPKPRVALSSVTSVGASTSGLEFVLGDTLGDASDGAIEGHYSIWTLDNEGVVKQRPNQSFSAGGIGPHTLKFQAAYGAYDANFNNPAPYLTPELTLGYTVKPFKVTINQPTSVGTDVQFTATERRTQQTGIITATNWTVNWTLNGNPYPAAATGVGTNAAQVVPIGTIPPLDVPKSLLVDGTVVGLTVTIDPAGLASVAQQYPTSSASMTLATPDPLIEVTGCENAGSPCKFTAKSAGGKSMDGWTYHWTLTRPSGTPLTSAAQVFQPALAEGGNYVITLKVTKTVFEVTAQKSLTVGATLCGPLPPAHEVQIQKDACLSTCAPGTTVNFYVSLRGYTRQECDVYDWTLPDGTKSSAETVSFTFNNPGTHVVRLRLSNPSTPTPLDEQVTVTVGSSSGGGDTSCTKPTIASFTYSAPNCTGTNCRTTDFIVFSARRGANSLQTCDNVSWDFGDGTTSTQRTPTKNFPTAGTYPVRLTISNSLGSVETQQNVIIVNPPTGSCNTPPQIGNFVIEYTGTQSACTQINRNNCNSGEPIAFTAQNYYYTVGACDSFEWDFGDGTKSTERNPTHVFNATSSSYTVKLRVFNSAGSYTYSRNVPFGNTAPTKPVPTITASNFPATAHKGKTVTFTATSNLATTTGWTWNFGDGSAADTSQAGTVSQTSTITHTFTRTGTFTVRVSARNSEDAATAPTNTAQANIVISEAPAIPEYRFLLPVTAHTAGQGGSAWRTDVQIYNPDPQVSETRPLVMEATFKGITKNLTMIKATHIYEDFLGGLLDHQKDDAGPVIITTKSAMTPPQIWTRTYTQTANGTYGQFIPAIRIDNVGGGAAPAEGKYHLSGLRHDNRYRTNVGLLNPNAAPINAKVTVYDERHFEIGSFTATLQPFQLDQFTLKSKVPALPDDAPFGVELEVPAGNWLVAYASFIDSMSNDPVYVPAVPESEVASSDFRTTLIPGVGHTGQWRSDVTIFNPDSKGVLFDLHYFNANGEKKGEALSVPLEPGKFLQYSDILRQGVFGNVEDGVGLLRISVKTSHDTYPMTFARTYFDNGAEGTYGQGIAGFAAARANVRPNKPAIIAGVRNAPPYKTNIGLVNLTGGAVTATVTLLDPVTGAAVSSVQYPIQPAQSIVGTFNGFGALTQGTFKIEATGNVWAFASIIDTRTFDPEYVPAIPVP